MTGMSIKKTLSITKKGDSLPADSSCPTATQRHWQEGHDLEERCRRRGICWTKVRLTVHGILQIDGIDSVEISGE